MKNRKNAFTKWLASVAVAASLAIITSSAGFAEDKQKLIVASFYPVNKVAGWEGMVAEFRKKYGDIEIEVQVTPLDRYLPKLLSQIAGGDAPDVVAVENTPFPQFVKRNILADLTSLMKDSEQFAKEDFFEHLLDRYTVDGSVYGIPYDAQPYAMLYYNPAMFKAAEVDVPTNDWTWDDMRAAALKLTDGDARISGLCLSSNNINNWRYFLFTGGGSFADDGHNMTRSPLADAASVEATKTYISMMNEDKSIPSRRAMESLGGSAQNCTNLFLNSKTAMMIGGMWKAVATPEAFRDLGVRVALGPVRDISKRVYPTGGTAYAILNSSDKKELAWSFLQEFLGQSGYRAAFKEAKLGAIYPPAHRPSFNWYMSQDIKFLDTIEPNADAMPFVRFEPFRTDWAEIKSRCIAPKIEAMLDGTVDTEATLKEMASCVDSSL